MTVRRLCPPRLLRQDFRKRRSTPFSLRAMSRRGSIEMRRDAWQRFLELPMPIGPRRRVDADRYSAVQARSLRSARSQDVQSTASEAALPHALLAEGVELGGRDVTHEQPAALSASLIREVGEGGVLFGSLDSARRRARRSAAAVFRAARRRSEQRQVLGTASGLLVRRNAAVCAQGVQLDEPLHSLSAMSDGGVDLGKTLVILEQGAEATLLSETASTSTAEAAACIAARSS